MHNTVVQIKCQNLLVLYVLTNVVSIGLTAARRCTTSEGCPKPCAACDAGQCFFTYKYIFDPSYRYTNCTPLPLVSCINRPTKYGKPDITTCNSPDGGECDRIEDSHVASCVCKSEYYGETCQYRKQGLKQTIRSLTIKHVDYVNPSKEHNLTVVLLGKTMADFTGLEEITVTTYDGYAKKIKPTGRNKNMCTGLALACIEFVFSDFKVSFRQYAWILPWLPGERYNVDGDQWFSTSNEIGGVRRNIGLKVKAVQNNLIYSSVSLDLFVNYRTFEKVILKCAPFIVKVTNCVRSYENPLRYKRASSIDMENTVIFLENGGYNNQSIEDKNCAKNGKLYWRVDSIDGTEHDLNPAIESYRVNIIKINPYTLPTGTYRAYLEWTAVEQDPIKSFVFCYFNVIEEPLVATISGGSDRLVMKHLGMSLSASESWDPNYKRSDPEQQLLRAKWKCKREPDTPDPLCQGWTKEMPISEPYLIKGSLLTYSAVYIFSLSIISLASDDPKPQYASVRIEVAPKISPTSTIFIKCVQNCGNIVIPNQILFIKAESANTSQYDESTWFYYKTNKQRDERPVDSIIEQNLPPQMLIIREDTLEMGTEYTVEVRVYSTGAYAKYSFQTAILVYEGNCTIEPSEGIRGESYFDIVCTQNETLLYEFYDKTLEEASEDIMFNGRMLGSSSDGTLLRVQLSRGTVVIYCIDSFGLHVNRTLQVELSSSGDNDLLERLLKYLTDSHKRNSDISNTLRIISLISDLVPSNVNKSIILNRLGYVISEIPVTTLQENKLSISTLANTLVSLNRPEQLMIKTHLMYRFQELIRDQTHILKINAKKPYTSRWMSPNELKQVCKYNLNCLHLTFQTRDIETEKVDPEGFHLQTLIELKSCSLFMEEAIDNIKDALSFLQAPGQPPTIVSIAEDSFVVWVLTNDDKDMPLKVNLANYKVIPVKISDILQKVLNKYIQRGQYLSLQVGSFKENIFWWSKSDISSNLVSTSLVVLPLTEQNLLRIKSLKPTIKMHFNLLGFERGKTIVNGSVNQLDPTLDVFYLDLHLLIHRINLPPRSLTTLTFLFPQTNGSLHLSASSNTRPEYKSVKESSILITEKSPNYIVPYYNNKEPIYLYLGIVPSSEVAVHDSVMYTFTLNTKVCQTWQQGLWSSEGCRINVESTEKDAYCQCDHLSFFSIATQQPMFPSLMDVIQDPKIIVTVLENPYVISFIVAVLLMYLLLCLILRYKDILDTKIQEIIILEDNFPDDPYPYLIAVYTSPRYNAGTTAHVGFRLFGTAASSRAHVFRSSERRVLRRGCDDWFLIFTENYLEALTSIHLWHDNAGRSPAWYCNKINVFDLTKNEQYQFVVGEWMALRTNCYPEVVSIPLEEKDVNEIKRVFSENFVLGMRDNHMILSILFSHPRSQLTKVRRLSICMCGLMMSLLCSIVYYKPNITNRGIDDYHYTITIRELVIGLTNILMCVFITSIALFMFRRTRKYLKTSKTDTPSIQLYLRNTLGKKSIFLMRSIVYGKPKSAYINFWRIATRILKTPPLVPVRLRNKKLFETRKHWLMIAWIFCALIIVLCSFLVLVFGLTMGQVKCKQWLSTVLLTMGGYFFLFSPTKILICSVFFSVSFQRVCEINTYTISADDIQFVKTQAEKSDLQLVFDKRNNWMYSPLESNQRKKLLNKYEDRMKWRLSIDFLLSASFVFVTSIVVVNLWSAYYFNNHSIVGVITKSVLPYTQCHDFYSVKSIADLEVFLSSTFLHGIYSTRWYNNDLLDEGREFLFIYWLIDGINRMVGRPKIRQLRVLPEVVENYVIPKFFRNPEWSPSTEDTGVYSERWQPGSWRHIRGNDSAWKFSDPTLTSTQTIFRLYGASSRAFHNGGFSTTLGPRRIDAGKRLSDLRTSEWLDTRTKVVFVELTVYNVHYNLFTQVTLIVEYLASGKVLLKAKGTTLRYSLVVIVWHVAFLLYICYYVVRSFLLVNEQGITQFFLGIKNVLRLTIIGLTLAALAFLGLHISTSTLYSSKFLLKFRDKYFDFDGFTMYFFKMKVILSFLFSVSTFHVLFYINFGERFFNIFNILFLSMTWLFWMVLVLYFLIFTLTNVNHVLDITTAIWAEDIMLKHQLARQIRIEDSETCCLFLFICFILITMFIVKSGFLILFLNTVNLATYKRLRYSSKFNIALFILSKFKRRLQTENTNKI